MLCFPNAKINLGLSILRKRPDGFHDLESVFYPVGWSDALEILPASELSFQQSGITIPGNSADNLCLKAFLLLHQDFDIPFVKIHLHKAIPIGAGLGGGSADASFTLIALNELFELNLPVDILQQYARRLGSDCAFFIENKPVLCFEKGDVFQEVKLDLKGKYIVMVYPGIHISTAEAYQNVVPKLKEISVRDIVHTSISDWKKVLKNDFEENLFLKYPILAAIKQTLYENGAIYASMSGSGSTVFGIFEEPASLESLFPAEYQLWQGEL
jgi:4-diphosphocytidyl-2-C-methyl-D-erythritol kinase